MNRFKQDDVVLYSTTGEAIIGQIRGDNAVLVAWRDANQPDKWVFPKTKEGLLQLTSLTLHPDPDRVLAEFTAWRLTQ